MNQTTTPHGTIQHGDCIDIMAAMPKASVDFILTDPPYIVRYKDRSGRSIFNDSGAAWLKPSAAQMFRVLKPDSFCISFYGWIKLTCSWPHGRRQVFASAAISFSANATLPTATSCNTSMKARIS